MSISPQPVSFQFSNNFSTPAANAGSTDFSGDCRERTRARSPARSLFFRFGGHSGNWPKLREPQYLLAPGVSRANGNSRALHAGATDHDEFYAVSV